MSTLLSDSVSRLSTIISIFVHRWFQGHFNHVLSSPFCSQPAYRTHSTRFVPNTLFVFGKDSFALHALHSTPYDIVRVLSPLSWRIGKMHMKRALYTLRIRTHARITFFSLSCHFFPSLSFTLSSSPIWSWMSEHEENVIICSCILGIIVSWRWMDTAMWYSIHSYIPRLS